MITFLKSSYILLIGILLLTSCKQDTKFEVQQRTEFEVFDNIVGYRVETRLLLIVEGNKYSMISGDFAKTESEMYDMLAEQLRTVDSILTVSNIDKKGF